MRFNSFRFKISIFFSFVLSVLLLLYAFFLYWGLARALYDELDKELKNKALATAKVMRIYVRAVGDSPRIVNYVFNRISFPEDIDVSLELLAKIDFFWSQQFGKLNMQEDFLHLMSARDGETRGRSRRLSNDLRDVLAVLREDMTPGQEFSLVDIFYKHKMLRVISMPVVFQGQDRYVLQIATSQKPIVMILRERLSAIALSIPFIFILMFLLVRFFAGQLLRPLLDVTNAAERISYRDLGERLEPPRDNEEMRRLVAAFNEMTGRLEKSFRHIEEFSAQVAHELRTPLAIMRGESELALRKERDPAEYRRVIQVNVGEIKRMLRTVEDLLLLTRIDYHPDILKRERFDFGDFYREVYEQARVLGAEKGVAISFEAPAERMPVLGDQLHLRRLFYNLIHNAVRFSVPNGTVVLTAGLKNGYIHAVVADTGCGIDPVILPRVFDRFFHKDRPDAQDEPGNGLGLSIALAIAHGHGGDILVQSRPGEGAVFTVILPLLAS